MLKIRTKKTLNDLLARCREHPNDNLIVMISQYEGDNRKDEKILSINYVLGSFKINITYPLPYLEPTAQKTYNREYNIKEETEENIKRIKEILYGEIRIVYND